MRNSFKINTASKQQQQNKLLLGKTKNEVD